MILYPSIDKLIDLVDSKYTLVIASSKRARMLQEGARPHATAKSGKFVSVALKELEDQSMTYVRTREGIK
ncbi:DNA-directed RNA polymerase subunit omega [Sulfoacidibacillus ferrooxidans]|uniref:DNA-directed RNA polymerase subunit omega n=1 Tax=Sulfoacidibacillus ferrooxidans TaxID=2005001 RepID=A0A9X1VBD9_9BACL|nr:DNA-directed RNA polymerase subunit omega [Sulfoacidibacillus ferrooxidans]MCI0184175.1 DNA-directed RNA polymerase subunit omega [Sulfoacidibacillus ferrooxidans]